MKQPADLPAIQAKRLAGREPFHHHGRGLGFDVLSFWQWAASDLLSNALRGVLAEYLVARALGVELSVRREWDAYDCVSPGGQKVEVKSAAYVQSWHQTRPSIIRFGIRPTLAWDPATNEFAKERRRQADVYVFCVLAHRDPATLDPLDLAQWEFYVLATADLEQLGDQATIGLSGILQLGAEPVAFDGVRSAVDEAAGGLYDP